MLEQQSVEQLKKLKLSGMAESYELQLSQPDTYDDLGFNDRFAVLIENEITYRDNKRLSRLLRGARFKMAAQLENVDYTHPRGLQKSHIANLQTEQWLVKKRNVIITGPTGCGKTFLSCALGHFACIKGYSVKYFRASRLLESLAVSHADGSYLKLINQLAKTDLLIVDDWGLDRLTQEHKNDLLEVMEDRHGLKSTIIASQLPITKWHAYLNDATLADAILDRLVHNSHKLKLKGESMRKKLSSLSQDEHLNLK